MDDMTVPHAGFYGWNAKNKAFSRLITHNAIFSKGWSVVGSECILQNKQITFWITKRENVQYTAAVISLHDAPVLYCKRPIWRVGVWPKLVGPAHNTLTSQPTLYTFSLKYVGIQKWAIFQWYFWKYNNLNFFHHCR